MKYPKWSPKLFLMTSLALVSCDLSKKTNEVKNKIENIFSRDFHSEYIKKGKHRLLRVTGNNLDKLHTIASTEFIKKIEKEIKNPRNSYIMANFKTNVEFINGQYLFEYSLNLNPSNNLKPQRVIDIRGTVIKDGKSTKKIVKMENKKKVPNWVNKMRKNYKDVFIEKAISDKNGLFHEAFLAKATVKK